MAQFVAEFFGTALLIILGCGVCANVNLKDSNGVASGWIVITAGWSMAVYVAVLATMDVSGAHLNPAVTVGLAVSGHFPWASVGSYLAAQLLGAFSGAVVVFLVYGDHFRLTEDPGPILGTFATGAAVRTPWRNVLTEAVGTAVLVASVLAITPGSFTGATDGGMTTEGIVGLGSLGALPVALVVFGIGLSLGGPTGYAINPARDFGPRLAHAILPIANKGDSDWGYAWIPVVGPLVGAVLAAVLWQALHPLI